MREIIVEVTCPGSQVKAVSFGKEVKILTPG
jgi:hypothetical protein